MNSVSLVDRTLVGIVFISVDQSYQDRVPVDDHDVDVNVNVGDVRIAALSHGRSARVAQLHEHVGAASRDRSDLTPIADPITTQPARKSTAIITRAAEMPSRVAASRLGSRVTSAP